MDYSVFTNLEVAGGQELFRSDANSDRYGMITQSANPRTNPEGLPVGWPSGRSRTGAGRATTSG